MADRNLVGAFAVGVLVGGVSAAVSALLLAPQSGRETRTLIKDRSIELRDRAQHTYEETIARAEAIVNEAARQIKKPSEVDAKQPEEPLNV